MTHKKGIHFFICFLIFSCLSYSATITDIVKIAQISVVTIVTYDITGTPKSQGSGFFIDINGRILTNEHVIRGAYSAMVLSGTMDYLNVTVLKTDKQLDLAIIQVDTSKEIEIPLFIDTSYVPQPGERVIAIGSPLGLEQTISDGLISGIRNIGDSLQFIQTTAPISSGSSGSPLLNMDGKVIGVNSSTFAEGQNINFAISASTIKLFLSKPEIYKPLKPAKTKVGFRVVLKWIGKILGTIILILLGGWWYAFPLLFLGIYLVYLLIKGIVLLVAKFLRMFKQKTKKDYSQSTYIPLPDQSVKNEYEVFEDEETKSSEVEEDKFTFHCWKCGTLLSAKISDKGIRAQCPNCQTILNVP